MEFKDVSMEQRRTYTYPGGNAVVIDAPRSLHVAASGSHRIVADTLHYLPPGFIHIEIELRPDAKHAFSF